MSTVWQKSVCRVCYRLPGAERFTVLSSSQAPDVLSSLDGLCERSGFLIAPFTPSRDCPVVMVRPDRIEHRTPEGQPPTRGDRAASVPPVPEDYRRSFGAFHSAVGSGRFDKLVLAASLRRPVRLDNSGAETLFLEACRTYPDFMVTLFSTPPTGTWLTVSPELLLDGKEDRWRTMALAGTMPLGEKDWSEKNRREQALVERFVRETLERFSSHIDRRGPESRRAGHLQHLCTVFDFRMERERLGALLSALHPTPAVSGLGRDGALDFIRTHEGHKRRYYSGFCGPTDPREGTRLYVTLRSAAIDAERGEATLWAGGGIMPDSRLEEEWTEVVQKMHTVNRLIDYV
jgi:isochorismate synthase